MRHTSEVLVWWKYQRSEFKRAQQLAPPAATLCLWAEIYEYLLKYLTQIFLKRSTPFEYVLSLKKRQHGRPRKEHLDRRPCQGPKVRKNSGCWKSLKALSIMDSVKVSSWSWRDVRDARRWWDAAGRTSAIGSVWSQERPIIQRRPKLGFRL